MILIVILLSACGSNPGPSVLAEEALVMDPLQSLTLVSLEDATDKDIEPHLRERNGETKVLICHVPPGNPAARRSILIDFKAWDAHAHHGEPARRPNREPRERDYLGSCRGVEVPDIILDDPVYPEDGPVCEGLQGAAFFDCLEKEAQGL